MDADARGRSADRGRPGVLQSSGLASGVAELKRREGRAGEASSAKMGAARVRRGREMEAEGNCGYLLGAEGVMARSGDERGGRRAEAARVDEGEDDDDAEDEDGVGDDGDRLRDLGAQKEKGRGLL